MRSRHPPLLSIFGSTTQIPQSGWQELKESLASAIATGCSSARRLRQLHARIVSSGLRHNLYLCGLLIGKYSSFRDLGAACGVFYSLYPPPTKALIWNVLMRECLRNGRPDLALGVFSEMTTGFPGCGPDSATFHLSIKASIDTRDFEFGFHLAECVRSRGLESDLLVSTSLLDMYSRSGDIVAARKLFEKMTVRDVVSWNAMISGYALRRSLPDAINLFKAMKADNGVAPSQATLVTLLSLCGRTESLEHGQTFHGHAIRLGYSSDIFISNALMEMYIKCNCLDSASLLFEKMTLKDPVSWSTMIGGYLHHRRPHDSLKLFRHMVSSTQFSSTRPILLNVLHACADLGDWHQGNHVEAEFLRNRFELDAQLGTALIFMYAKCGRVDIAFDVMNENVMIMKDVIAWNALIRGCAEAGNLRKASESSVEMQRRGVVPNSVTLLTLISIASLIPFLSMGMMVHAHVLRRGFFKERPISNSLIDMYSQCGNVEDSYKVFDGIADKDVVTWSSMMKAYAQNGGVDEVLNLFGLMKESGTKPNHITFVSVLSACSCGGYIDEARELFKCMKEDHGLEPWLEHYACMVDLLSRLGYLSEAFDFIKRGPAEVSASCLFGNWVIGEAAAKHLFYWEPQNAANYIILANIYISAGRREDANSILWLMRAVGLEKNPGFSLLMGG
ncbi:unnamed protein product [Spirodela intermedia]|uniref:Uncharacterized protein n=1 Tax=Spirodela intermedia TaxID=51605 RepID=A0A7I8JRU0_SPIIN|nr:unnamed protein product [Spirodela intermedia]CAA6672906.1 unnamed protein product [Spirodela intermedia]